MTTPTERAVIFGSGTRGRDAFEALGLGAAIVGFVDNDPLLQHSTVLDRPVFAPAALATLDFDVVYIASSQVELIREQLAQQNISPSRVRLAPHLADPTAPPPPPVVENPLSNYIDKGFKEIAGWLYMPAVEATLMLADIQRAHLAPGPICEIGVWEGRYLSLLSFLSATPQRVVAIDPLIHGGNRDAQLARLKHNIASYARRPDLITLLERDSKEVSPAEIIAIAGGKVHFMSVDGDHTMEGALHDLQLAEAVVAPGGIVALDDIPNFSCPGVTEAVMRHSLSDASQLAPFFLVANKLFLAHKSHCEIYRQAVVERAEARQAGEWGQRMLEHRKRMKSLNVPVRFLGQELLVVV